MTSSLIRCFVFNVTYSVFYHHLMMPLFWRVCPMLTDLLSLHWLFKTLGWLRKKPTTKMWHLGNSLPHTEALTWCLKYCNTVVAVLNILFSPSCDYEKDFCFKIWWLLIWFFLFIAKMSNCMSSSCVPPTLCDVLLCHVMCSHPP